MMRSPQTTSTGSKVRAKASGEATRATSSRDTIPVLSLFAGAGGLDVGFHQARFATLLALDVEDSAVATLRLNRSARKARKIDLSESTAEEIGNHLSKGLPRVVIGGPPCQGFSAGNVRQSRQDPRNRLPFHYARLLEGLAEQYPIDLFVFENVRGLAHTRHANRLARIKRAFRAAGFILSTCEVDAQDYGVAQSRRRLFIIGTRASLKSTFSFEPPPATTVATVRDAIGHLPEPTFFRRGMNPSDVKFHPNHWTMEPKSARFEKQEFNKWRSFRQLDWDQPSPTVAYGNREIHVHPNGRRRLSILEAMLLQGFPHSYVLCGNFSEQVKQVCNAVPPPVAKALATQIREFLLELETTR